jgi:hypothetical protein
MIVVPHLRFIRSLHHCEIIFLIFLFVVLLQLCPFLLMTISALMLHDSYHRVCEESDRIVCIIIIFYFQLFLLCEVDWVDQDISVTWDLLEILSMSCYGLESVVEVSKHSGLRLDLIRSLLFSAEILIVTLPFTLEKELSNLICADSFIRSSMWKLITVVSSYNRWSELSLPCLNALQWAGWWFIVIVFLSFYHHIIIMFLMLVFTTMRVLSRYYSDIQMYVILPRHCCQCCSYFNLVNPYGLSSKWHRGNKYYCIRSLLMMWKWQQWDRKDKNASTSPFCWVKKKHFQWRCFLMVMLGVSYTLSSPTSVSIIMLFLFLCLLSYATLLLSCFMHDSKAISIFSLINLQ